MTPQTVSLETSQKLKEIGYYNSSFRYWNQQQVPKGRMWVIVASKYEQKHISDEDSRPAPQINELLDQLPQSISIHKNAIDSHRYEETVGWHVRCHKDYPEQHITAAIIPPSLHTYHKSLIEALADMLILCVKEGYITLN